MSILITTIIYFRYKEVSQVAPLYSTARSLTSTVHVNICLRVSVCKINNL